MCKVLYYTYRNKRQEFLNDDAALKALIVANSERAIDIINCRQQIELLLTDVQEPVKSQLMKRLNTLAFYNPTDICKLVIHINQIEEILSTIDQPTRSRFYESIINAALINYQTAYGMVNSIKNCEKMLCGVRQDIKNKLYSIFLPNQLSQMKQAANQIQTIESLMNKVRPSTREKFYDHLIDSVLSVEKYVNSPETLNMTKFIKEIDDIACDIKNEQDLNYFDKCFVFTTMQNPEGRIKLHGIALYFKSISDPNSNLIVSKCQGNQMYDPYSKFTGYNLVSCFS